MTSLRFPMIAILAGLYAASLCLPVMTLGGAAGETWPGIAVLLTGWLGFLFFEFGWLANLFLVPVLVLMGTRQPAVSVSLILAVPLTLLGVDALSWDRTLGNDGAVMIAGYGPGYYLWLAVILSAGPLLVLRAIGAASATPAAIHRARRLA